MKTWRMSFWQSIWIPLESSGKEQHTTLANSIYPSACSRLYNRGSANFDVENYEAAIENLLKVVRMDESYDSGNAM